MLENLRRKSLTKTYIDPRHQVSFELGYAHYENHLSIEQYKQRVSKKKITKLFPNPFTQVSKEFRVFHFSLGAIKFNMIYCPKDTFTMGHRNQSDNKPRTETIDVSFFLGETEITQELYEKVIGTNPSAFKNNPQNPVERVSWYDAILFCNELSRLQGLDECYVLKNISTKDRDGVDQNRIISAQVTCDAKKNGYRLPTEKEWEYAAKAGTENRWAGTDNADELGEYAWFGQNLSNGSTQPVGTKVPNEWGFYDMSGNVREWCWDKHEPKGSVSDWRVYRGGGWSGSANHVYSTFRNIGSPEYNDKGLFGFRVARSIVS